MEKDFLRILQSHVEAQLITNIMALRFFYNYGIRLPEICLNMILISIQATTVPWVAVKELKLSYFLGETLLFTMYTHYGNLI